MGLLMAADPRFSAGARLERKAILAHVRRVLKSFTVAGDADDVLLKLESWVLKRQARYDKQPGGLGKR